LLEKQDAFILEFVRQKRFCFLKRGMSLITSVSFAAPAPPPFQAREKNVGVGGGRWRGGTVQAGVSCGTRRLARSCFPPCPCPPPARHSSTSAARACLARSTSSSRLGRHPHDTVAAWRGILQSARGTGCDADLKHWDVRPRRRQARELRLLHSSRRYRFDRLLDLNVFYDNLETWLNIVSP
jgi:hypothetical protein